MNIKRMLIIFVVVIILILVIIVLLIASQNNDPGGTFLRKKKFEFMFISEEKVNESIFSDKPILKRDNRIVWWEELPGNIAIQEFEEKYNISVPDIDMERNSVIVSFGRKIEKLRYFSSERYSNSNNYVAIVTFSNGFYESTVFYYMFGRIRNEQGFVFVPSRLDSPCFIMNEEETYIGPNLFILSE